MDFDQILHMWLLNKYWQHLAWDCHHGNISVWSWSLQTSTYIVKTRFDEVKKKEEKKKKKKNNKARNCGFQ